MKVLTTPLKKYFFLSHRFIINGICHQMSYNTIKIQK